MSVRVFLNSTGGQQVESIIVADRMSHELMALSVQSASLLPSAPGGAPIARFMFRLRDAPPPTQAPPFFSLFFGE